MDNIEENCDNGVSSNDESEFEYPPEVEVVLKEDQNTEEEQYDAEDQMRDFVYPLQFLLEEKEDNNDISCHEDEYDDHMYEDEDNASEDEVKVKRKKVKHKCGVSEKKRDKYWPTYIRLKRLQHENYVQVLCPCCDQKIKSFAMWVRHVKLKHLHFTKQIQANYHFKGSHRAVCKLCKQILRLDVSRFIHYLTDHCPERFDLFMCNLCDYKDNSVDCILKHLDERHKDDDLYRLCPLCSTTFADGNLMRQHISNEHNAEFKAKFSYNCHLCKHPRFDEESHYYDHLINVHRLFGSAWEQLHFKKQVGANKRQLLCKKCSQSCDKTGPHNKLLEHYLTHEDNCFWCCKYCDSKLQYTESMHLCSQMYKFLNKGNNFVKHHPTTHSNVSIIKDSKQMEDWQQFELYIMHSCPYCNDDFNDFQQWQLHLRQQHYINSLKGLHMSLVEDDPEQFRCLHCAALIPRTSVDLHTHCFQHLPYMPYKCRQCSKSLKNETTALKHAFNKCKDDDSHPLSLDNDQADMVIGPKLLDDDSNWIEILCALCKSEQFSSTSDIESHFRTHHNNFEENYRKSSNKLDMICKNCKTTLRSVSSDVCLSHYIKHLKDGPYKCLHCRRSYNTFKICRRHLRRFHNKSGKVKVYQPKRKHIPINNSSNRTPVKANLDLSLLNASTPGDTKITTNGIVSTSDKSYIFNEFQEFITYACAACNAAFDKKELWSEHVHTQHTFFNDNELSVKSGVDSKHRCRQCNLVLDSSISQRRKHALTHMPYKSFVCSLCYTRCNNLGPLYGHLRGVHFTKGAFECPICLINLTTSYERSQHVNQTHPRSEWPKNMCAICYRNYTALSIHMLSHDENRPRYICPECNGTFINFKEFQIHMERKHNTKIGKEIKPIVLRLSNKNGESSKEVDNESSKINSFESKTKKQKLLNIGKDTKTTMSRENSAKGKINKMTKLSSKKVSQRKAVTTRKKKSSEIPTESPNKRRSQRQIDITNTRKQLK